MAKISVIIPVYNREKLLQPCLDSLKNQTFRDFELVLVDDCSTDGSRAVLQQFLDEHPTIQGHIHATPVNSGVSAARNVGIRQAQGDYIFFMDSDDALSEQGLEQLYAQAEREDLDVVIGENLIVGETEKRMRVDIEGNLVRGNDEILRLFTTGKWYNVVWNKLIRRSIVTENRLLFQEGCIFEDELWSFCLATKVQTLGIVHQATYYYKVGHVSIMTSNQKVKRWTRFLDILPHMKRYIWEEKLTANPDVTLFYLQKLVGVVNALNAEHALDYPTFRRIRALSVGQVFALYRRGYLTRNQFVGWFFMVLPAPVGYPYYKLLGKMC